MYLILFIGGNAIIPALVFLCCVIASCYYLYIGIETAVVAYKQGTKIGLEAAYQQI